MSYVVRLGELYVQCNRIFSVKRLIVCVVAVGLDVLGQVVAVVAVGGYLCVFCKIHGKGMAYVVSHFAEILHVILMEKSSSVRRDI